MTGGSQPRRDDATLMWFLVRIALPVVVAVAAIIYLAEHL